MKLSQWLDIQKAAMKEGESPNDNPIFWFALREYRLHLGLEPDPEMEERLASSPLGMWLIRRSYAFDGGKEQ